MTNTRSDFYLAKLAKKQDDIKFLKKLILFTIAMTAYFYVAELICPQFVK